ncbi:MAG: Hpt domain-containing protein [Candidatus Cloacimonetes bacterium]|nr:Hpt domain-containing protein [Candidatus Cloacimonadota bacterium]
MLDFIDNELKEEFFDEFKELGRDVEEYLLKLEKEPDNKEYIRELFRPFHTIKGNAGLIGEKEIQSVSQLAESILDEVRQGRQKLSQEMLDVCLQAIDVIKEISVLRDPKALSNEIEKVMNELQNVLNNLNKNKERTTDTQKVKQKSYTQILNLNQDKVKRIIKALKKLDTYIEQMKLKRDFAWFLPDTFDAVLDISSDTPKTRTIQQINGILDYLEIYLTALNLEDVILYTPEKWELLNKMRNDLLFQFFPLCLESLNVKILYFNEDDPVEEMLQETEMMFSKEVNFVIINLNIHRTPGQEDIQMLFSLSEKYKTKILFVQRYLGQKELWHSLSLLMDNTPVIYKNFWMALYQIAEND